MQLQLQSYADAWARTKTNRARIYQKRQGVEDSGFSRSVESDFPILSIRPKFTLDRSERIFTIGSCFARNVESYLVRQGLNLLTSECVLSGDLYRLEGLGARNGALNAYTPSSMLDIMRLGDRDDRMSAGMIFDGDRYHDMISTGLKPLTEQEASSVRSMILRTYERLSEATTVIITLGYTESWYDNQDEMWVNKSPAGDRKTLRFADRFSFANLTAEQSTSVLREIVHYIGTKTGDRAKVILTASPVPLHGTFTDRDVVSANLYSKSTLLSSAVTIASEYDNVDYFPSYELVTMARPELAWEDDGVHVKPSLVERVMQVFQEQYVV